MTIRTKLPILFVLVVVLIVLLAALMLPNSLPLIEAIMLLAITIWGAASLQYIIVQRTRARLWVYAGFLTLAGLVVPTSLLPDHRLGLPQPLGTLVAVIIFILPSLGITLVGLIFQTGINDYIEWKQTITAENPYRQAVNQPNGRVVWFVFMLAILLLGKTLYNIYWLLVWDSTYDSFDFLWIVLPIFAAFVTVLASIKSLVGMSRSARNEKITFAGAVFLLMIPVLLITTYGSANQVNFRQLTEERATRLSQAIEAYYARKGVYPQNLGQLTPWYLLAIPVPVIINGADWCYDGGDGYYRLGYINRENWSAPQITGRLFKSQGDITNLPPLCEREIAELKKLDPGFWMGGN
jgi:hypothetical protein